MMKAAQAYFQTQVQTTSQGQLLLMLYDGAVKFLKQAKTKIQERDYAQKGILISKAIDVISELDSSLNPEKGGELATNLHNLYFFCNTRLLQANMKMDTKLIDDVIDILNGLRDAYAQITEMAEAGNVTAAAQSATPAPKPAQTNSAKHAPTAGVQAETAYSAAKPRPTAQPAQNGATPQQHDQQAPHPSHQNAQPGAAAEKPLQQSTKQPPNGKHPAATQPANGHPAAQKPANAQPAAQKPANGQQSKPKPNLSPENQDAKPLEQDSKRRLLAGSNIYRRMAQQQQS